jgi:hypothetical protein
MKTLSGQSELIEKERIRLQINAQVEEFLRRGGAIEVVTLSAKPAVADVGSVWEDEADEEDEEELTSFSD